MKAIITGGAGFIGSNLAEVLSRDNEVIIVDDLSTGNDANIRGFEIEFVKGSVTDLDLLRKIFKGADYVFHQAAIPSVPRSIKDPVSTNEANVTGTLKVLIAARDCSVKKVIFASSSSAYGDTPELPKREDMNPNPLSPYAVTKLIGEYYCNVFDEVYDLKTAALRYFNVYGPKQDPYSDYAAVIPKFIKRIQEGKPPIIYGDGNQTRDFTSVDDVVSANILAAESDAKGVYNVATGKRITINELASVIMAIMGQDLDPIHEKQREGDVLHSLGDITKAKKDFGYAPGDKLEANLKETVKWFRELYSSE
uniref:ADP-L-glycero-D-manno-heptose-6-epimerase n=1 Tax=Candidatus Methanophaga sp. ANME-1 ERB7 TaxID=2759913 RepID=A0A7G9Z5C9_9EURY|nr:ADP-L-glycero-D-manno-heptose-6-epimerase [Methanosarcinales archaeon ANME-1 ERB7]